MVVTRASFILALNRCGIVNDDLVSAICDNQGIVKMESLAQLSSKEIDAMAVAITKIPRTPAQGPLVISALSLKKLKAMREFVLWRNRFGFEVDHDDFDEAELVSTLERMNFETRVKETDVPGGKVPEKLKGIAKWRPFWKQFDAYCQTIRGTMFLPISYVYREHVEVEEEMFEEEYLTSDAQFMNTVQLDGDDYKMDNMLLWELLAPLVMDGSAWAFIKHLEKKKDGRAAVFALKEQGDGDAADSTRKAAAYATLNSTTYTGTNRCFPLMSILKPCRKASRSCLNVVSRCLYRKKWIS
jgi:hypothetical protein